MTVVHTLPEGWFELSADEAAAFAAELQRELAPSHPVFGLPAHCIARRRDRDDFLFSLPTHSQPLAIVHLTWSQEDSPDFPETIFFKDADDFAHNWKRIFD